MCDCMRKVGGIFTAEMSTADPFAAVESAIESYYVCDDRPKQCVESASACNVHGAEVLVSVT